MADELTSEELARIRGNAPCEHGRQRRKCEVCELIATEAENAELRAEVERMKEAFDETVKALQFQPDLGLPLGVNVGVGAARVIRDLRAELAEYIRCRKDLQRVLAIRDRAEKAESERNAALDKVKQAEGGLLRIAAELLGYDSTDDVSISYGEHGHSGAGWYGYVGEYPEDGSTQLFDLGPSDIVVDLRAEVERMRGAFQNEVKQLGESRARNVRLELAIRQCLPMLPQYYRDLVRNALTDARSDAAE